MQRLIQVQFLYYKLIKQTNYTQCVNTYHCYYYCTCTGGSSGAALSVVLIKAAKNLKDGQRCLPDSIRNCLLVTIYIHTYNTLVFMTSSTYVHISVHITQKILISIDSNGKRLCERN